MEPKVKTSKERKSSQVSKYAHQTNNYLKDSEIKEKRI